MSSDEEYLDNLLKSMSEGTGSDSNRIMSSDEIEAMFAAAEAAASEETEKQAEAVNEETEKQAADAEIKETATEAADAVTEEETEEAADAEMEEPATEAADAVTKEPATEAVDAVTGEQTEEAVVEEFEKLFAEFAAEEPEEDAEEELSTEAFEGSHTVESTRNLSREEIEKLLEASGQSEPETAAKEPELIEDGAELADDLMALLGSLQDDGDIGEINELLEKAENNEAVDESVFAATTVSPVMEEFAPFSDETEEESDDPETVDGKRKSRKERKAKREKKEKKVKADKPAKPEKAEKKAKKEKGEKKPGIFSKLFTSLTQEEEPSADEDENRAIIAALEAEDLEAAGKKKLKKGKMPASGKKGKNRGGDAEEDGDSKGKKTKPQKEKQKKVKKPKKEKPPKPVVEEKPGRRISKKSIMVVLLFAATVMAVVMFAVTFLSGVLRKQDAKAAFNRQDYMSCYETLYGMDLSEEEQEMFDHAEIVLRTDRRLTVYEKFMQEEEELKALDSLMQALAAYDEVYGKAQECGAAIEVAGIYDRIWQILSDSYGLSQEEARAIALCENNVDYTKYLTALVSGQGVSGENGIILPKEELEDILPAEEELNNPSFAD